MLCKCGHGDHRGRWCPRCEDFCHSDFLAQDIDGEDPGEPPIAPPRDGQRWHNGRKVPPRYDGCG